VQNPVRESIRDFFRFSRFGGKREEIFFFCPSVLFRVQNFSTTTSRARTNVASRARSRLRVQFRGT
jgi:hypothetical protein